MVMDTIMLTNQNRAGGQGPSASRRQAQSFKRRLTFLPDSPLRDTIESTSCLGVEVGKGIRLDAIGHHAADDRRRQMLRERSSCEHPPPSTQHCRIEIAKGADLLGDLPLRFRTIH